ncbi:sigma-E factor negative regulatory protein [Marinobacter salinisoli]|uniref:Sigma-E factor negative regulatory protein n=1 Tax=Marinobacter salinisoli TaxID=2769486 RepID=A0ABX7MXX4_9GAMM|nr:sigma-E factor negative regulatory protein [Marinobacter salinisoli]QSP96302.1 sigma-E factor negative regulatory protein [Marinobacter salinisoli]
MDDRLRETLSAMMDDEADELSVRRLLSHDGQDQVRDQWQRWQQVRCLMHSRPSPVDGFDVSSGVWQAIEGRSHAGKSPDAGTAASVSRWQWPAVAMVVAALAVGFGVGSGWESTESPSVPAVVASEQSVGTTPEVALQGLDQDQWEYMSRYLLEHAQHNSVAAGRGAVGYARLVSASGGADY